ncbi:hypothetical protein [Castellaniella denitrificans]|uniref:Phage tail protein n=1 Tax=Castellaniella denitrificans TaxID=56119 RepID=A0ABT4M602_9BURK|nr:hypothetical protein [Castellaniella denitrificans]MCZ4330742.1 hypothetical protein [Castellaniella denitrificans]
MLSLAQQVGQFTNFNLRTEKHGPDNVPGADLKVTTTLSNDVLAEFHPTLKSMLFRKPNPGEEDLVDKAGEAGETRLRFGSNINAIRWVHQIVGAGFTVHYGTGKSDIELTDTTIDGFVIEPMDGGSVVVSFRVKCNPDEKQVGKLSTLMGGEIEFSLVPPEDGPIQ